MTTPSSGAISIGNLQAALGVTSLSAMRSKNPAFDNSNTLNLSDMRGMPGGLVGWYDGDSWTGTQWTDKSGSGNHCTEKTGTILYDAYTPCNTYIRGGTTAGLRFPSTILPSSFTLFHIAKYTGETRGRIISGLSNNWLSGHHTQHAGKAYYTGWITDSTANPYATEWLLSCSKNTSYRGQGIDLTTASSGSGSTQLALNYGYYGAPSGTQPSDWACASVLVYNRDLPVGEIVKIENELARKYMIQQLPPVQEGLLGYYPAEDWGSAGWRDRSGNGNTATTFSGTITRNYNAFNGRDFISGDTTAYITFPSAILPATYTLFHVTRYNGATRGRIIRASDTNWLSGHYNGRSGLTFHNGWMTQTANNVHGNNWVLSTDQNRLYRSNRVDRTTGEPGTPSYGRLSVNSSGSELSDWACAMIIVYNRTLSLAEINTVEDWIAQRYNMQFSNTHRYVDFNNSTIDRTGNSITTLTGSVTYASGIVNRAAYFNNAYGSVAPANYLTIPNGDLFLNSTISYWFNADDTTVNYQTMVAATQSGNTYGCMQLDLILSSTFRAFIALPSQTWNVQLTATSINAGTWYHVVITITSAFVCTLYINGTQVSTGTGTAAPTAGWATNYMLGGSGSLARGFKGYLDEFRVYNRVLSATEILTLYSQTFRSNSILNTSSAYRWLKFDGTISDTTGLSTPSQVGSITYLPGISGQAAYLYQTDLNVNSTNYIMVPNDGYWGNMTVSFWFNTPAFNNTNGQTVVSLTNSASSAPSIQLDIQTSTVLRAYIRIPNYWTVNVATAALSANTWYHAVLTISSSHVCTLYLNAVQASTATGTGAPPSDSCFMWKIGGSGDNGRGYTGYLDDFRVFREVLTLDQIRALYSVGQDVTKYTTSVNTTNVYDNLMTGSLVSVPTYAPPITTGLTLWLDAENHRPTSTIWVDQSGNNYNFNIVASALRYDGLRQHMNFEGSYGIAKRTTDTPIYANATMVVFTSIRTDAGEWRTLTRGLNNDHHVIVQTSTNLLGTYDHNNGGAFLATTVNISNLFNVYTEFNMWVIKFSKTSPYFQFSYNGTTTLATITDVKAVFDNGFAAIGGWQANNTTDSSIAQQYWGKISNFLYYNRHLTDAEIRSIFNTYRFRYNLFWENDPRNIDDGAWNVLYELTNPSRDTSGNLVYTQNNVTALTSVPFTRVAYYMQNKMGNGTTTYWVYVSFDAWSSTLTDYRIPDASNIFTHNRNVTNIRVYSNHPQVGNYSVPQGRVFINPYNYSNATTFGDGSATAHDYDDTPVVVTVGANSGHGAVQVHDITNKRTILAWNMHWNTTYSPTIGIGNNDVTNIHKSAASDHPNWTGAYNGAYGWKFQVLVGMPTATRVMHLRGFTGDTWLDASGNGYNATYVGGTLSTPNYGGGYSTPANQISRYIIMPEAALQALPNGLNWTIHTWMEILSPSNLRYFHSMASPAADNGAILTINTSTIDLWNGTRTAGTDPTWTVNVPMLISWVRESATTWKIYKNGVYAATYTFTGIDTKTVTGWILDQEQDSVKGGFSAAQNTNANWYEISLMNRAQTADEILAEYNATKSRFGGDTLELPVTSGLYLWLDASDDSTFTLSTNNVTEWRDKSGNNRHYTQATAASQPIRNTTRNGRSVVTFDGTKGMTPPSALGNFSAGGTVIVAAKPTGTGYHCFYDSTSSYPMLWYRPDLRLELDAQIALSPTIYQNNAWFYSVQTVGTRNEWYLNGNYIAAGRAPSTSALTLWNRADGQRYNGDFGEVIVYDRTLSSMEITLINQYLAKKWCIGGMMDRLSPAAKASLKGAYSLRRLSIYYTGPTINVRRSSDNATSDFYADINGKLGQGVDATGTSLATWLGAGTGFVTTWYDQSGTGNHATQTTTATQPKVTQNSNWIDFNTNLYFNLPNGTVPFNNSHYTIVCKHNTMTNTIGGYIGSGNYGTVNQTNTIRRDPNGGYYNYWFSVDIFIAGYAVGNIVTFRYDGANRYGYINGSLIGTTASANRASTSANNTLGAGWVANGEYMNGEMYYLYIFDSSLSDADRVIAEFA